MIEYRGLNLSTGSDIDLSSSDLLIIPQEGNNQLYFYGDSNYSYDDQDRMLIQFVIDPMVLSQGLYTHILVTQYRDLDISMQNWDLYEIEDLGPDNYIVELPFFPSKNKWYIRFANKYELSDDPKDFDNIPAVIWVMSEDDYPVITNQTEHFTYIDNTDFECIFFEREAPDNT